MNEGSEQNGREQAREDASPGHALPGTDIDLPAWFREVDHTGDVAIEVFAPTQAELFERAGWGLFNILADMPSVEPRAEQELVIEGRDRDDLLVRWLSELNFLHITGGWLFIRFRIQEIDDRRLVARVRGERYDPERHVVYTEVKAITYHNLSITHDADGWNVQVVFDM